MDVPQLRTILHVAELGSLPKAAERLRIAQPALSRQVRMLEEELGIRLFDRHGRGMVVTEAGQDVLRHAQRIIGEIPKRRAFATVLECARSPRCSKTRLRHGARTRGATLAHPARSCHPDAQGGPFVTIPR